MKLSEQNLRSDAERLGECLTAKELKLAAAESCTGGLLAKIVTDIAGSSAWFECSVVSYSNDSKQRLLGVPDEILQNYGAVSRETVVTMSSGLFKRTDADVVVSISGIAGPGGGSDEKPVGLVWFSWSERDKPLYAESCLFDGGRESVRRQAVQHALKHLLKMLNA